MGTSSVIGLYKTELILRKGPWGDREHVGFRTLEWVAWFNQRHLLEPIGYVPPIEHEEEYDRRQHEQVAQAGLR